MDINSPNYSFESVPLRQFLRRQSDNLNDTGYRTLTHNLHETLTGYNNTMRIYNENMSSFLLLADEYRRDIRMFQHESNLNTTRHTNTRYSGNRNGSQSRTFTRPTRLPPTIFSNLSSTYENVIVRPSQNQINNAIETVVYSNELSLMNNRCPITMEDFIVGERISMIRHCRHSFLENAIQSWFQTNVRCPVCRYDIRESSNNTGQDISHNNIDTAENTGINNDTINQLTLQLSNLLSEALASQSMTDISQNSYLLFDIPITVTRRIEVEVDDYDDEDDDDDNIEDVEGIE
jgi:hypothetical protein